MPNCDGKRCGADDECGGTCLTGTCSGNQICDGGRCHDCDVCLPAGACPYRSVQAAVDPGGPATIRICSGIYVEDSTAQFRAVNITRSLRLVGSGDGLDPTTNTHLRPKITSKQVVGASGDSGIIEVTLDRLHITGGTGANGRGVGFASVIGTISNCTITGNESRLSGGSLGAFITNTRVTLINTHVTNNTGLGAGGIGVGGNVRVTLDALSRVTRNVATAGFGGIRNDPGGIVDLAIVANVTGNFSSGTNPNCGGGGQFNGEGMICQGI